MKQKKYPLVTIITPAYNRENLIEETINSILSQNYPNLEYIIIDDGSKDKTLLTIQKYKKKVTIIAQENKGETKTVNKGFSLAKGDIVAVINSDDPLLPHSIQTVVDFMESHPLILAVYPDWIVIDEFSHKKQTVLVSDYNYKTMIADHYCMMGPGTFFRKEAIRLTGGRNETFKFVADFAFFLKLGMYGPIAHIPKVLATFRVHSGSQGIYARGRSMAKEHIRLVDWIYNDPDLPQEMMNVKRQAYASAYFHGAGEHTQLIGKGVYYLFSFVMSPQIFLKKIRYEIVKLKHRLIAQVS